ncbi:hypothetical protein [Alicyclobacillus ferrooxydans]|uniref:Uncharacterized protein n=1 Tax=Alicyclobacillus ferrooxydans TaxID=471514 RepID=A0A0P9GPS2_9BACL|nr:hypothetical protein [Alicyclobacillus ferrooxydans]KPV42691.1 hypothetical protein AN477_16295 [Alicyclobacillus ferrooxydans]
MKWLVAGIFLAVFSIMIHVAILSNAVAQHADEQLHYTLESATHAAVLMVVPSSVSDGDITYDQTKANDIFRQIVATNLALNPTTLAPLPNSPYQSPLVIDSEAFIDYSDVSSFPYVYKNPTYGIDVTLHGPAVVYVVQIPIPRAFNASLAYPIRWTVIQAYPYAAP